MQPYKLETELTDYLPIPRELIAADLPSTALLLYGALLDRATLSQKNGYADESGRVYVIYPAQKLAERFQISDKTVKRNLQELERRGLICRQHKARREPSHIYLQLPKESVKAGDAGTKCPAKRPKMTSSRGQKCPSNNRREQQENINYYQHGEDESL